MNNLIPDGWEATDIGELTKTQSLFKDGDWVESKDQDPLGNNRLIQLADIGDGRFINKSSRYMNDEQFDRLKCTELKKGDVLIGRMPEPLGRACIYPLENVKAATIVDIAIIRTKNADHYWLMSAINSSDFRYHIDLNASGTTRTRIARGALAKLMLIAPPLPEQQKIAKILTSVDEVIEKTQAQIDKLKNLKTGMMQELLTNGIGHTEFKDSPVGRIPAEWEVVPLGRKAKLIPGYAFNSSDFVSSGVPLIRMGNLYQNKLSLSRAPKHLPLDFIEKHNKFVIKENDIVFSMTGTAGKEDYGYAVNVPENTPLCLLNQRVAKIVAGDNLNVQFLLHLLHSRMFLNEIYAVGTGTKQANLSSAHILNVELAFPPLKEQLKIAIALDSVSDRISIIKEKLAQLNNTKKALMQDLLTGKVRVKV